MKVIEWGLFIFAPVLGGLALFQNGVLHDSEGNRMLYVIVWTFAFMLWRDNSKDFNKKS